MPNVHQILIFIPCSSLQELFKYEVNGNDIHCRRKSIGNEVALLNIGKTI